MMTSAEKKRAIPFWEKTHLTLCEASAYTGIGEDKLREISDFEDCDFVLWVGTKRFLNRKKLESYLDKQYSI